MIHKTTHERDARQAGIRQFLSGRTLTANQIESIDLITNYLTGHGAMETDRLYELPFTDFNPLRVEPLQGDRSYLIVHSSQPNQSQSS